MPGEHALVDDDEPCESEASHNRRVVCEQKA
jgi:hypothetical protein